MARLAISVFWLVGVLAARGVDRQFAYEMPLMGTMWRVVLYTEEEDAAKMAADAVFKRLEGLNLVMSDYLPDSEVRRLTTESQQTSEDLFAVMSVSMELAKDSGGAFDVTAGVLTRIWKRALRRMELPGEDSIQSARKLTGWSLVEIDRESRGIALKREGMRIDLGGIGKGYALDQAMEVLKNEHGITRALVDAGGDVIAGDPPPGLQAWTVTVKGNGRDFLLQVANEAVATSGDLYQGEEIGGIRYSHLIDPRKGVALKDGAAATVVASRAWLADGLASAVCVLEGRDAERLIGKKKAAARVTRRLPSEQLKTVDFGRFTPVMPN